MTINFTVSGNTIQLNREEVEKRLIGLRNAKKSTHLIKTDLSVEKMGFFKKICWIILRIFPSIRNKTFQTNLNETTLNLTSLEIAVSEDPRLTALVNECFEVLKQKKNESSKTHTKIQWTTQGLFNGPNWKRRSKRYLKQLQKKAPEGITFNKKKLSWLTLGGNCTAISLNFIRLYLEKIQGSQPDLDLDIPLKGRLKKIARVSKWGGGWLEMRAQQNAFNCIEVTNRSRADHVSTKVEAIANFHDLKTDYTSRTFDILKDLKSDLLSVTDTLEEGIYFLRVIQPADNEKLEVKGHSMVFLRTSEGDYFFDPNKGLEKIEGDTNERILAHLKHNYKRFGITQASFHKIVQK